MSNSQINVSGRVISKTEEDEYGVIKGSEYFQEIYAEVMNDSADNHAADRDIQIYEELEIQTKKGGIINNIKPGEVNSEDSFVVDGQSSIKKRILLEEAK